MFKIEENEKFFYKVVGELNHLEWKLEWYKDTSPEGYCWANRKVINVGPANENVKRLILHEIAHIDTCSEHGNKHKKEFWLRYEKLLEKYLPGTELSNFDKHCKKVYCGN